MGIKNLSKFLREEYPEIYEPIHISEYRYKKVAIDISLYLCSYKALYNNPKDPDDMSGWLKAFIRLVASLRENEVHCVFIYDTKSPPEKDAEKQSRMEQREKLAERIYDLEMAVEKYHNTREIDPLLYEFQEKKKIKTSLLQKKDLNIRAIEFALEKMQKQLFSISKADFDATKELFDILDVPYMNAPMEAETMCADLCVQGKVDAVISEDTDVLAYGAPVFLTKYDTREGVCMRINYEKLLKAVEMTQEQFLDFCIMCGTDYNKNIFRVGPKKSFSHILEHKSIENIGKNTKLDISILNHVRSRELFTQYERSKGKIGYCGKPDFERLKQFMFKKNVNVDISALEKAFVEKEIIFENVS